MTLHALKILQEKDESLGWNLLDIQNILEDVKADLFPIIKVFNSGLKVYDISYAGVKFPALIQKTRKGKLIMITVYKEYSFE